MHIRMSSCVFLLSTKDVIFYNEAMKTEPELINTLEEILSEARSEPVWVKDIQPLSGGCINHATRVNTNVGSYFAKWNEEGPPDLFVREAESLRELGRACSLLQIPGVIVAQVSPALLITTFLDPPSPAGPQQEETLGQGIAELHRFTNERYGFYHDNYCGATQQDNRWNTDWIDFFGRQRIGHLVQRTEERRGWSSAERKTYERLQERLPEWISHQPRPALNHGDLWSGNYLYTAAGPALIDPASYYADREFDLALMAMFGGYGPRVWDAYREAYPLEVGWRDRQDLYMLYHYLNHYYLFGGGYGRQALAIAEKYGGRL